MAKATSVETRTADVSGEEGAPAAKRRARRAARAAGRKEEIAGAYWEQVLDGREPASVFQFVKAHGWKEEEFYEHFSHFDAIESGFWQEYTKETIGLLEADEEAGGYDASQTLLAFYFTFFGGLPKHRSKLLRLPRGLETVRKTAGMQEVFGEFCERLIAQGRDEQRISGPARLDFLYRRGLQLQLQFLLEYHRRDASEKFEDTDALIEKSVRFFFDAAHWGVAESALDLARFLIPRVAK